MNWMYNVWSFNNSSSVPASYLAKWFWAEPIIDRTSLRGTSDL